MAIQHDTEIASQMTQAFESGLGELRTSPRAQGASYSNLYGVTKGVETNNQYLDLVSRYQSAFSAFSQKINAVSQAFEALDHSEAQSTFGRGQ